VGLHWMLVMRHYVCLHLLLVIRHRVGVPALDAGNDDTECVPALAPGNEDILCVPALAAGYETLCVCACTDCW